MASLTTSNARHGRPKLHADIQDVSHEVHEEFDQWFDAGTIDECLATVAAQFADAKIRAFVPLLVRRDVRDELQTRLLHA